MTDQLTPLTEPPAEAPDVPSIELGDVEQLGDVNDALSRFYEQQASEVAQRTGASEREIRQWIEDHLISENGFRTQSLAGTGAAAAEVLAELEDAHLIRTESRRGTRWYELSHDRLVAPVRTSNEQWRVDHLSPLQNTTREWVGHDRSDGLLISGDVLAEADEWAAQHPDQLLDEEREYLDKCREREAAATALDRSSRRNLILAVVAFVLLAIAGVVAFVAWKSQQEADDQRAAAVAAQKLADDERVKAENAQIRAEEQAKQARASELASRSRELQEDDPALALAVAAESTAVTEPPRPDTVRAVVDARVTLAEQWSPAGEPAQFTSGVVGVSISPDDRHVAVGDSKVLHVFDRLSGAPLDPPVEHRGDIFDTAFGADGLLASAGREGEVFLWEFDGSAYRTVGPPLDHSADGVEGPLVRTVTFSPDGKLLASGDDRGRVWLWDLTVDPPAGRVLDRDPLGDDDGTNPGDVFDLAFRSDGTILASAEGAAEVEGALKNDGDSDGQVVLWDVAAGRAVRRLVTPIDAESPTRAAAFAVAFHPRFLFDPGPPDFEIDILAVGHADGTIWYWWSPNSEPRPGDDPPTAHRVLAHDRAVLGLAFDPLGELLVSASTDRTVKLWESPSPPYDTWPQLGAPLTRHEEYVGAVAFTSDGEEFVSSSGDHTVRRWALPRDEGLGNTPAADVEDVQRVAEADSVPLVRTLDHGECPDRARPEQGCWANSVAYSPDGAVLASTGYDGRIKLWDPRTEAQLGVIAPDDDDLVPDDDSAARLYSVTFGPTRDVLVAAGHGRVWLWDGSAGLTALDHEPESALPVTDVAIDPTGRWAVTSGRDGFVRLFDLEERTEVDSASTEVEGGLDAVSVGPDGLIAAGARSGEVWMWQVESGELQLVDVRDDLHENRLRDVAFGGQLLASAGKDSVIKLWAPPSMPTGDAKDLRGHADEVGALRFNADATLLASAGNDGTVRLWSLDPAWAVDPAALVAASRPIAGVKLDALSPECDSEECFVLDLAFADDADGTNAMASVGTDGLVRIWDRPWDPERACEIATTYLTPDDDGGKERLQDELADLPIEVCTWD